MELMQDNEKGLKQELVADSLDYENFDFDAMEEVLNQEVGDLVADLESLGEEELLTNPDSLGKEIYNSIFNQLGAQSGLDLSSEKLIDKYRRTHKDETSQSAGVAALRGRIVKLSAHLSHKKLHKVFSSLDIFVVCCLIYFPIPE